MSRAAIPRIIDGEEINFAAGPFRNLTPQTTGTGVLKSYVTSTTALTAAELNIARAYLILFGRSPERAGLAYWLGEIGSMASIETATDGINAAIAGAYILDYAPSVMVARMFHGLFGKVYAEDPGGQDYWAARIAGGLETLGSTTTALVSAALGISGYHADTMRNRFLVLESICRLQAAHSRDLSYQTARSIILRVDGTLASYDDAMEDVHRLLVLGTANPTNAWDKSYTASTFLADCRTPDNTAIRQQRRLVWYNRAGDMMLAVAYLPSNFESASEHRGIIGLHGGGWRQGYPEVIYDYATALAGSGTDPSYVVICPQYRLTSYGYNNPNLEEDVEDFWNLLADSSSSFLKLAAGKVGLFGESAGGHLACMLGSTIDAHRVLALYPPIDLRGDPAVSAGLDPYVDYFAPTSGEKDAASPSLVWSSARTTKFQLWHGNSDSFVPPAQTTAFDTAVGANCATRFRAGEGHGFTSSVKAEVIADAITFFDERQALEP